MNKKNYTALKLSTPTEFLLAFYYSLSSVLSDSASLILSTESLSFFNNNIPVKSLPWSTLLYSNHLFLSTWYRTSEPPTSGLYLPLGLTPPPLQFSSVPFHIFCDYEWKISSSQAEIPLLYWREPALPGRHFSI